MPARDLLIYRSEAIIFWQAAYTSQTTERQEAKTSLLVPKQYYFPLPWYSTLLM